MGLLHFPYKNVIVIDVFVNQELCILIKKLYSLRSQNKGEQLQPNRELSTASKIPYLTFSVICKHVIKLTITYMHKQFRLKKKTRVCWDIDAIGLKTPSLNFYFERQVSVTVAMFFSSLFKNESRTADFNFFRCCQFHHLHPSYLLLDLKKNKSQTFRFKESKQ